MSERFNFTTELDVPCPCGGKVSVGKAGQIPAVMHTDPACGDFVQRDVTDFLAWMNKQRQQELMQMIEVLPEGNGVQFHLPEKTVRLTFSPNAVALLRDYISAGSVDFAPRDVLLEVRFEAYPISEASA